MKIAAEHRRLYNEWIAAYPSRDPIERGFVQQAVVAQLEKRRLERSPRGRCGPSGYGRPSCTLSASRKTRWSAACTLFNDSCDDGMRHLLRSAAGCRWAIASGKSFKKMLTEDGTWYGVHRIDASSSRGFRRASTSSSYREEAYRTWLDCLVAQPNPKQKDIDLILDPRHVPKSIQDRDVKLWPGDPAASRARLQAIVDRELPRLRALEETLRVQYEEPARAAAKDLALAQVTKEEMSLLRAERMHEQSYAQAVRALQKVRKQARPRSRRSPETGDGRVAIVDPSGVDDREALVGRSDDRRMPQAPSTGVAIC